MQNPGQLPISSSKKAKNEDGMGNKEVPSSKTGVFKDGYQFCQKPDGYRSFIASA